MTKRIVRVIARGLFRSNLLAFIKENWLRLCCARILKEISKGLLPISCFRDEKVYFRDEEKKDWWVSDEEELYNQFVQICRRYFKEKVV